LKYEEGAITLTIPLIDFLTSVLFAIFGQGGHEVDLYFALFLPFSHKNRLFSQKSSSFPKKLLYLLLEWQIYLPTKKRKDACRAGLSY
jgi:hypothetical protein